MASVSRADGDHPRFMVQLSSDGMIKGNTGSRGKREICIGARVGAEDD